MERYPFYAGFVCRERRGVAHRVVIETEPTALLKSLLREKLQFIPSPMKDLSNIYKPGVRVFLVDDVGMMAQGPLRFQDMPDVHIGFWDKILVGREEMCWELARVVAEDAKVQGVWTAIPSAARATLAFAKRIGFKVFHQSDDVVALELLFT